MSNPAGNPVSKAAQAGLHAAGRLVRRLQQRLNGQTTGGTADTAFRDAEPRSRWRSVTINKSPQDVMRNGQAPGPLAALGDRVEVQVREAPGGKGTELAARLRAPEPSGPGAVRARVFGDDPRQQVRAALREAKQLIEVGEVIKVDPAPHGHRTATPTGKLVDLATRRSSGEGVL